MILKTFVLKMAQAEARIWPCLSNMFRVRSTAVGWMHGKGSRDGAHTYINVQRFRGALVFKAHRLLYDTTLGLRVIKKREGSRDGVHTRLLYHATLGLKL